MATSASSTATADAASAWTVTGEDVQVDHLGRSVDEEDLRHPLRLSGHWGARAGSKGAAPMVINKNQGAAAYASERTQGKRGSGSGGCSWVEVGGEDDHGHDGPGDVGSLRSGGWATWPTAATYTHVRSRCLGGKTPFPTSSTTYALLCAAAALVAFVTFASWSGDGSISTEQYRSRDWDGSRSRAASGGSGGIRTNDDDQHDNVRNGGIEDDFARARKERNSVKYKLYRSPSVQEEARSDVEEEFTANVDDVPEKHDEIAVDADKRSGAGDKPGSSTVAAETTGWQVVVPSAGQGAHSPQKAGSSSHVPGHPPP